MSLKEQINKAIGAHGMWKQHLRNAIEAGKSDFTVGNVSKDNLCDFGNWLYGPGLTAAEKGTLDFEKVKALHSRFHQCASKVLACALAGKRGEAESMMGVSGEFSSVSADLTRAMQVWKANASK
ncbi:MAG: CZB domain-containing protein [Alphaproteobacteria bacterium]|nr:CZB domain-containing protein [Alphaproteobacteria bacterium]